MSTREHVRQIININADKWGKCAYPDWSQRRKGISQSDVIEAGVRHACPVIPMVVSRDRPNRENWTSYQLKSYSHIAVSDMLAKVGRPDLQKDWNANEKRKANEKTDQSLVDEVMYPDKVNPRILPACTRTPQVLYADLFRNLALTADGERPDLACTVEEQAKFELPLKGLSKIASSAKDIQDFTSSVASHTAKVLVDNGVSQETVLSLLVNSFAKPGLIKETGQRLPAKQMIKKIESKMANETGLNNLPFNFVHASLALIG